MKLNDSLDNLFSQLDNLDADIIDCGSQSAKSQFNTEANLTGMETHKNRIFKVKDNGDNIDNITADADSQSDSILSSFKLFNDKSTKRTPQTPKSIEKKLATPRKSKQRNLNPDNNQPKINSFFDRGKAITRTTRSSLSQNNNASSATSGKWNIDTAVNTMTSRESVNSRADTSDAPSHSLRNRNVTDKYLGDDNKSKSNERKSAFDVLKQSSVNNIKQETIRGKSKMEAHSYQLRKKSSISETADSSDNLTSAPEEARPRYGNAKRSCPFYKKIPGLCSYRFIIFIFNRSKRYKIVNWCYE